MTIDHLQNRIDALDARVAAIEARAESTVASAASLMGRMTSDKKAAAARANGKKRWENHPKKQNEN
jgi:hypothetical protein